MKKKPRLKYLEILESTCMNKVNIGTPSESLKYPNETNEDRRFANKQAHISLQQIILEKEKQVAASADAIRKFRQSRDMSDFKKLRTDELNLFNLEKELAYFKALEEELF